MPCQDHGRSDSEGINRIQWEGKWLNPGVPPIVAYGHTHWAVPDLRPVPPLRVVIPERKPAMMQDISIDFRPNKLDAEIIAKVAKHWETGKAIRAFSNEHRRLSDYGYWYLLSTLWVSYSGWSDLGLWKRLFASQRPNRDTSLMKPSELSAWRRLPEILRCFRAHRPGEADWIAYTTDPIKCGCFALARGVGEVTEYEISKGAALCLFLRRGESEIIALDKSSARLIRTIPVLTHGDGEMGGKSVATRLIL